MRDSSGVTYTQEVNFNSCSIQNLYQLHSSSHYDFIHEAWKHVSCFYCHITMQTFPPTCDSYTNYRFFTNSAVDWQVDADGGHLSPCLTLQMLLNCSFFPLNCTLNRKLLRVWRLFVTLLLAQHSNYPPWIWFHPVSYRETKDLTQAQPKSLLISQVSVSWYLHLYAWLSGPVAMRQFKHRDNHSGGPGAGLRLRSQVSVCLWPPHTFTKAASLSDGQ